MIFQINLLCESIKVPVSSEWYNNFDRDYYKYGRWLDQQVIAIKVEEPISVRVVIWTLKILLFLILQSPKPVTLLLEVETRRFPV
jgi:hypothetical protein